MMNVFDKRKERFDLILTLVGKAKTIAIERMIAVISVELGMAERTVSKMVKTLIYADKLVNNEGMLSLPKGTTKKEKR